MWVQHNGPEKNLSYLSMLNHILRSECAIELYKRATKNMRVQVRVRVRMEIYNIYPPACMRNGTENLTFLLIFL